MSKKQFILDSLLHYFTDPTTCGMEGTECVFLSSEGKKCVIGQYIKPECYLPEMENIGSSQVGWTPSKILGANVLTDKAVEADLSAIQWDCLQATHDSLGLKQYSNTKSSIDALVREIGEPLPELSAALKGLIERGDWF